MPTPSPPVEPFANTATLERAAPNPNAPTRDLNRHPRRKRPDNRPLPTIPGYRIVSRLGRGGMGEVFEAVNARGHTVALKIIRRDRVSRTTIERFGREADAMFDLHHSNIAHFFTFDVAPDDTPFFTMKFVNGGTLADRFQEYQNDSRKAVSVMIKVAEAVQFLHAKGFIHRDLKPQNILIDRDGEPYVSDFGLVKDLDDLLNADEWAATPPSDTDPQLSRAETVVKIDDLAGRVPLTAGVIGTLPYASPEQLRNQKTLIGPGSDVWALGVILYEMFCGTRPFDSGDPNVLSSLIQTEAPHRPTNCNPGIPEEIERIILKCLSKVPQTRYASAKLLANDLSKWLAATAQVSAHHKVITRRRLLAAAIPCAAIGIGAYYFGRRDKKETPQLTPTEELNRDLTDKGRVDLIVDGVPRFALVIAGNPEFVVAQAADRLLELQPGRFSASFVDLVSGVEGAYRYSVLLRQVDGGAVGVYVCRTQEWSAGDAFHVFVAISVTKDNPPDRANPAEGPITMGVNCIDALRPSGFFSPPHIHQIKIAKSVDGWRQIDFDVSPETVRGIVDGNIISTPPRSYLLKSISEMAAPRKQMNALTPTFPANAAAGIFAMNGNLQVKNAWLERIS